jgi:hypothetical protein
MCLVTDTYVNTFSYPHTTAMIRRGGAWQNSMRFLDMASCLISILDVVVLQIRQVNLQTPQSTDETSLTQRQ